MSYTVAVLIGNDWLLLRVVAAWMLDNHES
jgi:hypothetical protein